jgi:hypothetical protein
MVDRGRVTRQAFFKEIFLSDMEERNSYVDQLLNDPFLAATFELAFRYWLELKDHGWDIPDIDKITAELMVAETKRILEDVNRGS